MTKFHVDAEHTAEVTFKATFVVEAENAKAASRKALSIAQTEKDIVWTASGRNPKPKSLKLAPPRVVS